MAFLENILRFSIAPNDGIHSFQSRNDGLERFDENILYPQKFKDISKKLLDFFSS
jgi:hypothetical protein